MPNLSEVAKAYGLLGYKINTFEELKFIVDYANKKNIFIWIAAMLPEDLDDEYNFYIKLNGLLIDFYRI